MHDCGLRELDEVTMRFLNALKRALLGDSAEPVVLDHADIAIRDSALDWRDAKLQEAAARYGKPFKCCAPSVPREVLVGGKELVTVAADEEVPTMLKTASVTKIGVKRKP